MSCDVLSCDEPSSVVLCNGMECYELVMRLVVRSRCVERLCDDVVIQSTTLYSVLCTTKNYNVNKVLLCTTKYYPVLLSTTKYYSVIL